MKISKPTAEIPNQFLVGNGSGEDTQFREIRLGEKTESGATCIAKFLIVVTEKDNQLDIAPVGNMKPNHFTPEFVQEVMDKSRDRWLQITKFRQNNAH